MKTGSRWRRLIPLLLSPLLLFGHCGDGDAATPPADALADAASDVVGDTDADAVEVADAADDATPATEPAWVVLPSVRAGEIQENAVVSLAGRIYVLGGFKNGFVIVPDVQVYDVDAGAWEAGPALPEALHHVNAAAVGGRLVVLGALATFGFTARDVAWSHTPGEGDWSPITPVGEGRHRGASAVAVVGDVAYIIGGFRGGGAVAEVDAYHATEDRWEALESLPAARDHVVAETVAGVIYVFGGRQVAIGSVVDEVWALDPAVGTWEARAPMPTARGGHMAGVVHGRIVVVGGEGNDQDPRGIFADVEVYDPATDTWAVLPPMRAPRHGTGAVGLGDALYVPGGADQQAFGAVDTFDALRFPEGWSPRR